MTRRRIAAAADATLTESSTRATVSQNKLATQRAELDAATDRLAQERASVSDDGPGGGGGRRAAGGGKR